MLHTSDVTQGVRQDDWFTTIDLKDVYFHIFIAPHHRQFLSLRLRREGLPVLRLAVRDFCGTQSFHKINHSSTVPASEQWHAHLPLPGRLAHLLAVKSGCAQRLGSANLNQAWAHCELCKELTYTQSEDCVYRQPTGLSTDEGSPITASGGRHCPTFTAVSEGPHSAVQIISGTTRHTHSGFISSVFGPPHVATSSGLDEQPWIAFSTPQTQTGKGHCGLREMLTSLEPRREQISTTVGLPEAHGPQNYRNSTQMCWS